MNVDLNIVEKASLGDRDAFSDIYYSCYKDFYKYAFFMLGNADDSEDVVADVFLEIWKSIGKLRNPKAFPAWAFKILSARCKKEISAKIKHRADSSLDDFIEISPLDSNNIEAEILQKVSVGSALDHLDDEERMIVMLSVYYGYTHSEIAEIIGKPQGTVGSKLYRAYAKLKTILAER